MLFALQHVGTLGGGNKDFLTHAWLLGSYAINAL